MIPVGMQYVYRRFIENKSSMWDKLAKKGVIKREVQKKLKRLNMGQQYCNIEYFLLVNQNYI